MECQGGGGLTLPTPLSFRSFQLFTGDDVPAAPIAACVILAWVILITGDQLDARGPFRNFWDGLASIAAS
jgi:hypothetical protein